jgi:hypothetical protein
MANTAPNYPTNLQELFSGPNPFLAQMGLQQFNTAQNQAGENLQSAIQDRTQSADMHPLKMAQQQAETGNTLASARLSNSTSAQHEDALKVLQGVPMDKRISAKLAETLKGRSDAERGMLDNEMLAASVYAAHGLQNNGQLPLPMLLKAKEQHPGLLPYLTKPGGLQQLAQVVNSYNALDPKRQQSDSGHTISAEASKEVARIGAQAQIDRVEAERRAGKYDHYRAQFQREKAKGGTFEQAANAWSAEAEEFGLLASQTSDPEERKYFLDRANNASQQAYAKQQAAMEKARQAAETANLGKPDLNALKDGKLQGIQPKGTPTPAPVSNPKPQNALPPGWDYKGTK